MDNTELALILYILWFLVLFGAIACLRAYVTLTGKKAANDFMPDGSDVSPLSGRLCRAHANGYESFPFIGGLLLFSLATDSTIVTDPLALWLVEARIVQSSIHIISTSVIAVQFRFFFFAVQWCIGAYWTILLLSKALQL